MKQRVILNQKSPICQHTKTIAIIYLDDQDIFVIECKYCKCSWSLDGEHGGIYANQ